MNYANMMPASALNNEALELSWKGDHAGSIAKHLQALKLKEAMPGNLEGIALTKNELGEEYMLVGKLDEAQACLESALSGRYGFDQASTLDNLGRLWEMKGDYAKAREYREKGAPDQMICSNFNCGKSQVNQYCTRMELSHCARCRCAFYCSQRCQKADWKRHKQYCKVVASD